jgi:hypothetical protein
LPSSSFLSMTERGQIRSPRGATATGRTTLSMDGIPDDAEEEDDDDEDGDDDIVCSRSPATTTGAAAVRERQRPHRFASVSTPYPVKIDNFTCDSHFNGSVDLYLMPIRVFNRIVRYSEKWCDCRGDDADIKVGGMSALPSALAAHRHGEREIMTRFYSNDYRFDDDCGRRRRRGRRQRRRRKRRRQRRRKRRGADTKT